MFLFLSKLLPLFLYPLGLACLLMVVALFMIWKRPRAAAAAISLALLVLLLTGNYWISSWLLRSLEWQNIPTANLPKAEAIVVLGGGTQPAFAPRPWINLNEQGDRILYGAKLYQEGKAPLLILSGGRIRWQGGGFPESADMAEIAQTMGVSRSVILQDSASLNTYQNAVNVRQLLDSRGIGPRVLLVTSALHMPRSLLVFKHQGIEVTAAPTDFQVTEADLQEIQSSPQAILINLLPDISRIQYSTQALKEYIGLAVYRLKGWL